MNQSVPGDGKTVDAVKVAEVSKFYDGRAVVDGLSFEVHAGECFGLLGPNGAGKTTTARLLLAQTPIDRGSIQVLGYQIPQQARQARMQIGVVSQDDNLDPDFTVTENLFTYARYFGISKRAFLGKYEELLAFAALESRARARIDELSGGMRRRLTLARALVNDPALLILDEPTTGLDPQARQVIWQRMRQLLKSGRTLILTTHYMEEAARICDRVAIVDHGRIAAMGEPKALTQRYIEPHVFEFYEPQLSFDPKELSNELDVRLECAGDAVYVYTSDAMRVRAWLEDRSEFGYVYRPSNLEDVFLRITGRELRD